MRLQGVTTEPADTMTAITTPVVEPYKYALVLNVNWPLAKHWRVSPKKAAVSFLISLQRESWVMVK